MKTLLAAILFFLMFGWLGVVLVGAFLAANPWLIALFVFFCAIGPVVRAFSPGKGSAKQ